RYNLQIASKTACLLRFALRVVQQRNEIMHTSFSPVKHFSEKNDRKVMCTPWVFFTYNNRAKISL
ncbi:hypothetical protein NQT62_14325, partial [Limnobacter humi]